MPAGQVRLWSVGGGGLEKPKERGAGRLLGSCTTGHRLSQDWTLLTPDPVLPGPGVEFYCLGNFRGPETKLVSFLSGIVVLY